MPNLLKTFQENQLYENTNFYSKIILARTFVYWPILNKICMNANIMKTQYMTWNVTFILWRNFVILFTIRPPDLITTLTNVLMETFVLVFIESYLLFWCHFGHNMNNMRYNSIKITLYSFTIPGEENIVICTYIFDSDLFFYTRNL